MSGASTRLLVAISIGESVAIEAYKEATKASFPVTKSLADKIIAEEAMHSRRFMQYLDMKKDKDKMFEEIDHLWEPVRNYDLQRRVSFFACLERGWFWTLGISRIFKRLGLMRDNKANRLIMWHCGLEGGHRNDSTELYEKIYGRLTLKQRLRSFIDVVNRYTALHWKYLY